MVPDWAGQDGSPTAERYRWMGEREVRGISPSYEAICLGVAEDKEVLARLDTLPAAKRQPNLLLGAVRYLGGPVRSWPEFREFVHDRWPHVESVMRARRTQTNEPSRCTAYLPVLAALPQPLALFEVGAAAGLCLYPDRYRYRYTGSTAASIGDSGPELRCTVDGPAPLPGRRPAVVWRGGLDLNPLDVRNADDVRWLECLIWPEQEYRRDVLRAAVETARAEPAAIVAGDLTRDLVAAAVQAPTDATLVLIHSAVLAYVDDDGRAAFADQLAELRRRRPVCWLANEAPGVVTGSREAGAVARFTLTLDGKPLARTGPHGESLEWLR